jgi:hypothetical protein
MRSPKPVWPRFFAAAGGFWLAAWLAACASDPRPDAVAGLPSPCSTVGAWVDPGTGSGLGHDDVVAAQAVRAVVLLGESHHDRRHHRWQLHTVAALHGRRPDIILGFEMFPRKAQPVLDRWVAGELATEALRRGSLPAAVPLRTPEPGADGRAQRRPRPGRAGRPGRLGRGCVGGS